MIPPAKSGGRRRMVNVREVLNGIFYILWTGCQWKAMPKDFPPKSTVHDYLELWNWNGTLERIHHELCVAVREQAGGEDYRMLIASRGDALTFLAPGSPAPVSVQPGKQASLCQPLTGPHDARTRTAAPKVGPSVCCLRRDGRKVCHEAQIVSPFQDPFSTVCRQIFLRDLFLKNTTGYAI
jgi:transposase